MKLNLNNTRNNNVSARVETILEAVKYINKYVDTTGLASSEMDCGFGELTDENTGKIIATISYNGMVIEMEERLK